MGPIPMDISKKYAAACMGVMNCASNFMYYALVCPRALPSPLRLRAEASVCCEVVPLPESDVPASTQFSAAALCPLPPSHLPRLFCPRADTSLSLMWT